MPDPRPIHDLILVCIGEDLVAEVLGTHVFIGRVQIDEGAAKLGMLERNGAAEPENG